MGPGSEPSEAARYGRAALIGLAVIFVMFVARPEIPPSYLLGVGLFVAAGVLMLRDKGRG